MITRIYQTKFASPEKTFGEDWDEIMSGNLDNFYKYNHLYKYVGSCDTSLELSTEKESYNASQILWKTFEITNERTNPFAIRNVTDEFRSLSNGDVVGCKGSTYILTSKGFIKLNIDKQGIIIQT